MLSTWVSSRYSDTGVRYELVKRVPDPGWAGGQVQGVLGDLLVCHMSFFAQTLCFLPDPAHHGQAPTEQQSMAFCPECSSPRCGCPGRGSGRVHQLGLRL